MTGSAAPTSRQLHRGHFAFMRALTQGLDGRQSWERYLRVGSEQADTRQVRQTIGWIRDAFAAAARREQRPGTARLILLDPDRFSSAPTLPTLEEFAAAEGLEDFSEAEQVEAYEAAHPEAGRAGQGSGATASRRARVIARQLEALRWLETLVARDPRPSDGVGGWLNPAVATRLESAGFTTLADLVHRINTHGARWWRSVPGVGAGKAARILDWLQAHEMALGIAVGSHGRRPRRALTSTALAAVVPAATALVPFEKLLLPAALNGQQGRFRAPAHRCRLCADDDHAAIAAWLAAKHGQGDAEAAPVLPLTATQRSYRREGERLLLWAVLERRTALSSLTPEDAAGYRDFLAAPPQAWCGPRHAQR
ncbi:MAG: integrase, partial [Comamonadaceae bacterium]